MTYDLKFSHVMAVLHCSWPYIWI